MATWGNAGRARRWTAIVVFLALVAVGCSGGGGHASSSSSGPAPKSADALIQGFAGVGITTFQGVDAPTPAVAAAGTEVLRLLRWQVDGMAAEAALHDGFSGDQLDDLAPVPNGMPQASALLSAYVKALDTPGAALARELMGQQDLTQPSLVVFPTAVLALFAAELTRAGQDAAVIDLPADAATAAVQPNSSAHAVVVDLSPSAARATTVCSQLQGFVENSLKPFFDKLPRVTPPQVSQGLGGIFGPLLQEALNLGAVIANGAIDVVKVVVVNGVAVVAKPILDAVVGVIGVVGTVAMIASALRPWVLTLQPDPAANRKAVSPEAGIAGQVKLVVNRGGFDDWPKDIADCASLLGRPLPSLSPEGSAVTWAVRGGASLVAVVRSASTLDRAGTASLAYQTTQEPSADGPASTALVAVEATVKRTEVAKIQQLIGDEVFSVVPSWAAGLLEPLLRPQLNKLTADLAKLADVRGTVFFPVTYHTAPPPASSSSGGPLRLTTDDPCALLTPAQVTQLGGGPGSKPERGPTVDVNSVDGASAGAAARVDTCTFAGLAGVALETLTAGQTTNFNPSQFVAGRAYDVSGEMGVTAMQRIPQNTVHAIIDETHIIFTWAGTDPLPPDAPAGTRPYANAALSLKTMKLVLDNLR